MVTGVSTPVATDAQLPAAADCDGGPEQLGSVPLPPQPPVARPATAPPDGPEPFYRVDLRLDDSVRTGESVPVTSTSTRAGTTTVQVPVELTVESDRDDDPESEPVA